MNLVGEDLLRRAVRMIHHETAQSGLFELCGSSNQVLLCRLQADLNLCFFEGCGGSHIFSRF